MRADSETLTENVTSKANWPLALSAGLLGIGQNGLLVMLPQLVTLTGLSLSVWAGLLMFGSMLFLPASPWWGRQSERRGCKVVMVPDQTQPDEKLKKCLYACVPTLADISHLI